MVDKCDFCNIEKDKLVLDTEHVLSFLDIQPLVSSKAHLLVIPRKHYVSLDELANDIDTSRELGVWLPRLAKAALEASGGKSFNIVQNNGERAGQVVPHVHFHIIVRDGDSGGRSDDVAELVEKFRKEYPFKDRIKYSMQVYGKGERNGPLGYDELTKRIKSVL